MKHLFSRHEFLNESKFKENQLDDQIINYITKNSWLSYDGKEDNKLIFSTRQNGSVYHEKHSPVDYKEAQRISNELKTTLFGKDLTSNVDTVDEWVSLYVEVPAEPEKEEKIFSGQINKDIDYLIDRSNTRKEYLLITFEYYGMTEEQIHNLRLAYQYDYLPHDDFKNVINSTINDLSIPTISDRNFKKSFESNFKKRIKWESKPYKVCYTTWGKWKFEGESITPDSINEIIGEVDGKYVIGKGVYRGYSDNRKSLWEEYKGTKRESEFVEVIDPKNVHVIPETEYKEIRKRLYNSYEYRKGRKQEKNKPVDDSKRVYPKHINYY
jgi:hypothetical protein